MLQLIFFCTILGWKKAKNMYVTNNNYDLHIQIYSSIILSYDSCMCVLFQINTMHIIHTHCKGLHGEACVGPFQSGGY